MPHTVAPLAALFIALAAPPPAAEPQSPAMILRHFENASYAAAAGLRWLCWRMQELTFRISCGIVAHWCFRVTLAC